VWAHAIGRMFAPQLRLLLYGAGPAERAVRRFAATTGYDGEIFFTGFRFGLCDVLAGADAALFLHDRPCGVGALARAMSGGLPIAASACGDIAVCAPKEHAALLSPPGDIRGAAANLMRLVEQADLRGRLGSRAAALAGERFTAKGARSRVSGIYGLVSAGGGSTGAEET